MIVLLLSAAPWLLCIWQTRRVGAAWWVVGITALCVQLVKMLLERIADFNPEKGKQSEQPQMMPGGWPELLRAAVGIVISVYVVQRILDEMEWLRGIVLMLMVLAGVMDYESPSSWRTYAIISALAFVGVVWGEWGAAAAPAVERATFAEYLQFVLSIHGVINGHVVSVEGGANNIFADGETAKRAISLVAVVVLSSRSEGGNALGMLLMILPAVCLKEKHAITACITPILDQICYPDLYPLRDPRKAEARNLLLVQQKQELLFYIMAWCVVVGLWAQTRPSVLVWVQIAGGLTYLASLRRYSNVIRILDFNRRHSFHQPTPTPTTKPEARHTSADKPTTVRRRQLEAEQHELLLTKMMALR